jgi:hypothetical protein
MNSNAERIANAVATPEGRMAMAQAMVQPLKRRANWSGIGKGFLVETECPYCKKTISIVDRNCSCGAWTHNIWGWINSGDVVVDEF